MLQSISHVTRAYIINADGLNGFLIEIEIIKVLTESEKNGQLEIAKRWQMIDLETVK